MKPVILITLSFLSGLLLGHAALYFPFTMTVLALAALLVSGLVVRSERLSLRQLALSAVPCVLGIASFIYSAACLPPDHYTRLIPAEEAAKHTMTGRIVSPLDRDPGRTSFIVALRELDSAPASGRVRVNVRDEQTDLGLGDAIRLFGRLYGPRGHNNPGGFGYPAFLAARGIYGTASLKDSGSIELVHRGRGIFRTIQDWRERIRRSFRT